MVPAAFQFISGLKQSRQGERINPIRPVQKITGSTLQATGVAHNQANGQMAGYGNAVANVRANTASTVLAAQESGSANNALAVIASAVTLGARAFTKNGMRAPTIVMSGTGSPLFSRCTWWRVQPVEL